MRTRAALGERYAKDKTGPETNRRTRQVEAAEQSKTHLECPYMRATHTNAHTSTGTHARAHARTHRFHSTHRERFSRSPVRGRNCPMEVRNCSACGHVANFGEMVSVFHDQ